MPSSHGGSRRFKSFTAYQQIQGVAVHGRDPFSFLLPFCYHFLQKPNFPTCKRHLGRGFITVALDNPIFVVSALKLPEGPAHLLDGGEGSQPEEIFLGDADQALGAAVGFRGPDKGGRALDSQEGEFFLKIMRHIPAAMIMPPKAWAAGGAKSPQYSLTPCLMSSRAWKRVPRLVA